MHQGRRIEQHHPLILRQTQRVHECRVVEATLLTQLTRDRTNVCDKLICGVCTHKYITNTRCKYRLRKSHVHSQTTSNPVHRNSFKQTHRNISVARGNAENTQSNTHPAHTINIEQSHNNTCKYA